MSRFFNGIGDLISVADDPLYEFTTSESYTWCLWARHDSVAGYQCYVAKMPPASGPSYIFRKSASNVIELEAGAIGASQNVLGTTALVAGAWYFVAVVRDVSADQIRLYLATAAGNVTLETSATDTTTTAHGENTGVLDIGQQTNGFRMNGRLANVMLFTHALSLNELQAVKHGGIVQNLAGFWPLWGVASPEPDLSGNGRNGTVIGAVAADHAPIGPYVGRA